MDTNFFQGFFKAEAAFPYRENVLFNKSFIRLVETVFLCSRNSVFMIRAIFLIVETIIGIRGKQFFKKKLILASGKLWFFRLVDTIFFLRFS